MTVTLTDLERRTGLDAFEHLARDVEIPVSGGIQAQGDVIVVPRAEASDVEVDGEFAEIPANGVEVIRGGAMNHPHVLVAEAGTARFASKVTDPANLALGVLVAEAPAYLLHPEHGGTGIAAGEYVIRRQREQTPQGQRLLAD